MLFLGGLRYKLIISFLLIGIVLVIGVMKFGPGYRGERMEIYKKYCLFFKADSIKIAPQKEYQVKESLTALTSGKLLGIGADWGRAKQYYLPEARTDYIFTVVGEEFGYLGALFILGLHCLLFFRIFLMSMKQKDTFLLLLSAGLGMNIFINVLVNIGVSMSILPSTGNTLPFISYSGTALLIDSASIGVILNISAKRKPV